MYLACLYISQDPHFGPYILGGTAIYIAYRIGIVLRLPFRIPLCRRFHPALGCCCCWWCWCWCWLRHRSNQLNQITPRTRILGRLQASFYPSDFTVVLGINYAAWLQHLTTFSSTNHSKVLEQHQQCSWLSPSLQGRRHNNLLLPILDQFSASQPQHSPLHAMEI